MADEVEKVNDGFLSKAGCNIGVLVGGIVLSIIGLALIAFGAVTVNIALLISGLILFAVGVILIIF